MGCSLDETSDSSPSGRKPRTPAQQRADYRKTLPRKANNRRAELIGMAGNQGFVTEAHSPADFLDRLSDAERAEYDECTRIMDEWWAGSPDGIAMRKQSERDRATIDMLRQRMGMSDDC